MSQERASQALLLLLAVMSGLYFLLALHPVWDVDVFWHIRTGQWVVEHLSLPSTDIFSAVEPGRAWVPFQWLYEVLCFAADSAGGLFAVRVMHAAVASAGVFLAGLAVWKEGRGLVLVVAALAAFQFADRLRVRPDVFNLALFWLVLPLVREERWSGRRIAVLVGVAGLWANLHAGGALLVPVLVLARAGGRVARRLCARLKGEAVTGRDVVYGLRSDLLVLLLVAAAMCPMPGFVRGAYQAFFMLGPSERFIPEWMGSVEFLLDHAAVAHEYVAGGLALAALPLLGGIVAWGLLRRRDGSGVLDLALAVPLAGLSLLHVRFLWLAAPVLAFFLVRLLAGERGGSVRRWVELGGLAALCAGLVSLDVHYHAVRNAGGMERVLDGIGVDLEPGYFPERAADFLARAGVAGRVLNHAPWGGYLLYRLWPGCLVATDGRGNFGEREAAWLSAMDSVGKRGGAVSEAVESVPFELVVHPNPFPLWDSAPERILWVYHDDLARVYLRVGANNEENLRKVALAAGIELGKLPEPGDRAGWGEVQRSLVRRFAVERLFEPAAAARVDALRARVDGGDAAAARDLAVLYFDLGLFAECRQVVSQVVPRTIEDDVLVLLASWAEGREEEAAASCAALALRVKGGETLSPRALGAVSSVCRQAGR